MSGAIIPPEHFFSIRKETPNPKQERNDLMAQAQALVAAVMELHGIEEDAAGLSLSAIRETETGRILSIHLTPVDMIDGEAVPRFQSAQPVNSH